ncbi:type II toxin-antitoxin system RelE/ParE family toxin [bacterium]|nr:type II toxin-antitoxin system RelE/ParE family toxin [bacterium]
MERTPIFEIRLLQEVKDDLDRLPDDVFSDLARVIDSLAYAPRREDAEELGDGFWLLRSPRFTIVYRIDDGRLVVVIVQVSRSGVPGNPAH